MSIESSENERDTVDGDIPSALRKSAISEEWVCLTINQRDADALEVEQANLERIIAQYQAESEKLLAQVQDLEERSKAEERELQVSSFSLRDGHPATCTRLNFSRFLSFLLDLNSNSHWCILTGFQELAERARELDPEERHPDKSSKTIKTLIEAFQKQLAEQRQGYGEGRAAGWRSLWGCVLVV